MQGTGRFSFLLGAAQTCHYVGDAISNLAGEYVAGRYGYIFAFKCLTFLSVVPIFVYYFIMPPNHESELSEHADEVCGDPDKSTTGLHIYATTFNELKTQSTMTVASCEGGGLVHDAE